MCSTDYLTKNIILVYYTYTNTSYLFGFKQDQFSLKERLLYDKLFLILFLRHKVHYNVMRCYALAFGSQILTLLSKDKMPMPVQNFWL